MEPFNGSNRVKDGCIISPDWVGEIEGGFEQSSCWVSLFEITRKLEVRNMIIDIHHGVFIMVGIVAKEKCIIKSCLGGENAGGDIACI